MTAFTQALQANAPAADRAGNMSLYGWLIGSWDIEVTRFLADGTRRQRSGEWHFGWILEGRAIQDVWIVPRRDAMHDSAAAQAGSNFYGTTLRIYDPNIDAWHIQWIEPVTQNYLSMIGRAEGDTIVQLGTDTAGQLARWSFSDITANSFVWRGETSADHGATWRLNVEFTARRANERKAVA